MEISPAGGGAKKANPQHAQAIKAGAKKADKIRQKAEAVHQLDVPVAEQQLEEELRQL